MVTKRRDVEEEHTIAPEIGNENADPVSADGAGAGAKSCADAVAERIATTVTANKIATTLNELVDCAIADQKESVLERESKGKSVILEYDEEEERRRGSWMGENVDSCTYNVQKFEFKKERTFIGGSPVSRCIGGHGD
ncbi:hypothetical protein U1Q18_023303, partial [Sarracenia purpurea var. burkii]